MTHGLHALLCALFSPFAVRSGKGPQPARRVQADLQALTNQEKRDLGLIDGQPCRGDNRPDEWSAIRPLLDRHRTPR